MKILGKPIPDFLSICKVLGTAMMLLLSNPSEGVDLPGNSIVFNNIASSSLSAPAPDPDDVIVCEGGDATFTVSGFASYQWEESPDGTTWTSMPGETFPSLTLNNVTFLMNGNRYRCLDGILYTSAAAILTVNPLPIAAGTITGTPTVCQGQNLVSYSVPVPGHIQDQEPP
jgi:hypothetical protein